MQIFVIELRGRERDIDRLRISRQRLGKRARLAKDDRDVLTFSGFDPAVDDKKLVVLQDLRKLSGPLRPGQTLDARRLVLKPKHAKAIAFLALANLEGGCDTRHRYRVACTN